MLRNSLRTISIILVRMLRYVANVPIWNDPFNITIDWCRDLYLRSLNERSRRAVPERMVEKRAISDYGDL